MGFSRSAINHDFKREGIRQLERAVFLFLRDEAATHPGVSQGFQVARGEVVISQRELALEFGLDDNRTIRRALQTLRRKGWLAIKTTPRKGTLIRVLRHLPKPEPAPLIEVPKDNQNASANDAKNQPVSWGEAAVLARGVDVAVDVCLAVGTAVSPAVNSFKVNIAPAHKECAGRTGFVQTPPAARATASGPKPDRDAVVNWALLTEHIQRSWTLKKEAPFMASRSDWHALKTATRVYQAHELAGLWNGFIESQDEFYVKTGYSLKVFVSAINALVDDRRWKIRAEEVLRTWVPKGAEEIDSITNSLGLSVKTIVDQITNTNVSPKRQNVSRRPPSVPPAPPKRFTKPPERPKSDAELAAEMAQEAELEKLQTPFQNWKRPVKPAPDPGK